MLVQYLAESVATCSFCNHVDSPYRLTSSIKSGFYSFQIYVCLDCASTFHKAVSEVKQKAPVASFIPMSEKIRLQSEEFEAVNDLLTAYNRLPAIVDDDYPEARHRYEGAMRTLIAAIKANGRLEE